jgi:hypothetical protein
MNAKIILLLVAILFTTKVFSQDPNFHIYLCFGQSNMEGQGEIREQDKTVDSRFKVMQALDCPDLGTKGKWRVAVPPLCQCSSGLTPVDYFGRTMIATLPKKVKVGVINVAIGGCDIRLFDKNLYKEFDDTYTESWFVDKIKAYKGNPYEYLIDLAKLAQKDGIIKGILLHQGETNTGDTLWPSYVKTIYDNIITDLSLNPDSVPLLAGEVVHEDQQGVCASMNPIIAILPDVLPNSYVISSRGCKAKEDNVHFNSEGYQKLGIRYAKKMLSLMGDVAVISESEIISEKQKLSNLLQSVKGEGILFGHQDTYAYGYTWKDVEGNSDVKRVTGDYPAVFGWELGGIEKGVKVNLDTVAFDNIRKYAIKAYNQGGVNTFSWHPFSVVDRKDSWNIQPRVVEKIIPGGEYHEAFKKDLDALANFFNSIVTEDGIKVPFIFRPWHEMDGTWFWWGRTSCSPDQMKKLFQFTVEYLRKVKGMDQMLVAYSPDRNFETREQYLTWYPGDEYIDVIGMDNYYDLYTDGLLDEAIKKLHIIINYANEVGKISALTETGYENIPDSTWYTRKLGVVLSDSIVAANISYTLVWRNDPSKHFFFPYPGHPSAKYAKELLDRDNMWLLNDLRKFKKQ